ncbi:hypothetical protein GMRT_13606 [Giardia muris]|uniref:Uncharacterized protein n=1 Tax=Giardia muris TaxID=5742 RepID=A0A4Z1SWA5_GIAMU|nr:hypothetical protein GMRT_13606 [Giardia muris]|eukprot:TNJ30026.1 hypothetical protein GMRT_13606 [Giardia muris]
MADDLELQGVMDWISKGSLGRAVLWVACQPPTNKSIVSTFWNSIFEPRYVKAISTTDPSEVMQLICQCALEDTQRVRDLLLCLEHENNERYDEITCLLYLGALINEPFWSEEQETWMMEGLQTIAMTKFIPGGLNECLKICDVPSTSRSSRTLSWLKKYVDRWEHSPRQQDWFTLYLDRDQLILRQYKARFIGLVLKAYLNGYTLVSITNIVNFFTSSVFLHEECLEAFSIYQKCYEKYVRRTHELGYSIDPLLTTSSSHIVQCNQLKLFILSNTKQVDIDLLDLSWLVGISNRMGERRDTMNPIGELYSILLLKAQLNDFWNATDGTASQHLYHTAQYIITHSCSEAFGPIVIGFRRFLAQKQHEKRTCQQCVLRMVMEYGLLPIFLERLPRDTILLIQDLLLMPPTRRRSSEAFKGLLLQVLASAPLHDGLDVDINMGLFRTVLQTVSVDLMDISILLDDLYNLLLSTETLTRRDCRLLLALLKLDLEHYEGRQSPLLILPEFHTRVRDTEIHLFKGQIEAITWEAIKRQPDRLTSFYSLFSSNRTLAIGVMAKLMKELSQEEREEVALVLDAMREEGSRP